MNASVSDRPRAGFPGFAHVLAGFVAGVALQLQQSALWPQAGYLAGAGAALALGLVWGLARIRRPGRAGMRFIEARSLTAGLLAAAVGFGLTGWQAGTLASTTLQPALEGRDIQIIGRVLAMPQAGEDGLQFRVAVESARADGQAVTLPPHVALGWYAGFGRRMADGLDDDPTAQELQRLPQDLRAGERWAMTVKLKAPHGSSNPHGFDYELWLWEQGLQATGYVRAGPNDTPPRKLSDSWAHPIERARQSVRDALYRHVDDRRRAGVLAALVVGDQNAIGRADWDVFRLTGVAHLMSISGLHITMFAWLASRLMAALWKGSVRLTPRLCLAWPAGAVGAWGGLALAVLYALFSGWGVPAQRTVWMLATMVALRQGGRQWPWWISWLLAMAVVVALDPWALMQAGFWLSFVAVGVLFATGSAQEAPAVPAGPDAAAGWRRRLAGPLRSLVGALREQWVVTLALTPLSLLLFNQVSLVGLLANAVAIPWVTLVVTPLAMAGVLWTPLWQPAALAAGGLTALLQWLAGWPMSSLGMASAPVGFAVAGVAGGLLLAARLPWHWKVMAMPLMLPVLLWQAPRVPPGQFELLAADIGQGNAVLVHTATHTLLYDTGPGFSRDSDAGQRVLVPLLRALGDRLDRLVLSHRDSDHIGGAPAVLAMQPQADLLSSIEDGHPLQALRPSVRCAAGQQWTWDGVQFEVLHPEAADYGSAAKSNAMSCVLRISNGARTALLVGDIEAAQEGRLALGAQRDRLKADVLLVPHHGSKTSSSAVFLDAVQPQLALVQAGYRNRFGHPVPSVVARYDERGIRLLRSSDCGAASWRSDAPGRATCQRDQDRRYWQYSAGLP